MGRLMCHPPNLPSIGNDLWAHLTGSHQQFAHLSSNACSKRGNLCSAPALERLGFTKSSRAKCASYASMQRCEAVLQVAASGETFAEASLVSSTHHHNRPVEGEYRYAARALNRYERSDAARCHSRAGARQGYRNCRTAMGARLRPSNGWSCTSPNSSRSAGTLRQRTCRTE
jgi:hypothetical protein